MGPTIDHLAHPIRPPQRFLLLAAILLTLAVVLLALAVGAAQATPNPSNSAVQTAIPVEELCLAEINRVELNERIPRALMRAIAVTESGRWIEDRQANFAWPWTINANGEGRFFPTKAAAIAEVKRLKAAGVHSVDVGCMQVNLHFHPTAFENLDDAFDPARNVAYGAKYLKELQQLRRSWADAVAYYHSASADYSIPYREKVYKAWATERKRAYDEERDAIIAAYAQRRAELDRQREAQRLAQERRQAEINARAGSGQRPSNAGLANAGLANAGPVQSNQTQAPSQPGGRTY
jgi:hypothetical protein